MAHFQNNFLLVPWTEVLGLSPVENTTKQFYSIGPRTLAREIAHSPKSSELKSGRTKSFQFASADGADRSGQLLLSVVF